MKNKILLKQIILVTDGESNGLKNPINSINPIVKSGITISVVGILDENSSESTLLEMQQIAQFGKGVFESTDLDNLNSTIYTTTQKSIYNTLNSVINHELKSLMNKDIKDINPNSREKVINMMEDLSDTLDLKTIILLDTSKSMKFKIQEAKKSIVNLLHILKSRKGKNNIGVVIFPYKDNDYKLICDFTDDINIIKNNLKKIDIGGLTPTAEALEGAFRIIEFNEVENNYRKRMDL
ncbi:VWA domain-containing protein [Senegalia sp. (in: firmicutes)]|uniref:vWA domain-containing protein n=1 Tax=Senegalia sp. (in: firmicutes) TaxID=1924098 RepID=UPI003F97B278